MLAFLKRWRPKSPPTQRRFVRPALELLERRDCPAAPVISAFSAIPLSGRMVHLTGNVADENPAAVLVTFSGVMTGTAEVDQYGVFSHVAEADSLGNVTAVALDDQGLSSAGRQAAVTSANPTIEVTVAHGANRTITLSGRVLDETPGGLTVNFSGVAVGAVVTNADGTFSKTLTASALGVVTATVQDVWGLACPNTQVQVTNVAPVISNFWGSEGVNGFWTFTGRVTDEFAPGLVIRFGGLSALIGKTVTVDENGEFSFTIQLGDDQEGTVTAMTTDWWGQNSNEACYLVHRTT